MSNSLIVGAPVRDRGWIIGNWFEYLAAAVEHETPTCTVGVVLVGSKDDPTREEAERAAKHFCMSLDWVEPEQDDVGPYERSWSMCRYDTMTSVRNTLLHRVRELQPDVFWSLDTDILVNEICLSSALRILKEDRFDAVGMKLYMTPKGRGAPSYALLPPRGGLRRPDHEGVIQVDAIMASKLMSPQAYNIDYSSHMQGEDIGWSINARRSGCKLGWDGTSISKHVMSKDQLKVVDQRCGY